MKLILSDIWQGRYTFEITDENDFNNILEYCRKHHKTCILIKVEK